MRLIQLKANKPSFHTVKFNPRGLSIVLGRSTGKQTADNKKTYNGLGKSLIIRLVHFCLGSEKIPAFTSALPDWEFTLEFEADKKIYSVTRRAAEQDQIIINGVKKSLPKYREQLASLAFGIDEKKKYLSFRSLITHFIRPTKQSYLTYNQIYKQETDYQRAINIGYLLGLDFELMLRKIELKEEQERTDKLRKNIENDEIFRSYFLEGKDYKSDLLDTKEQLAELEKRLTEFRVAKNYEALKIEADDVNRLLRRQRNRASMVSGAIALLDDRLARGAELTSATVIKMYREVGVVLKDSVIRSLEEVQSFHEKLIVNRSKRLTEEKSRFEKDRARIAREILRLSRRQDELMQILNTHGALEEFVALGKQQAVLRSRVEKLTAYEDILAKYRTKLNEIKVEFSQQTLLAEEYLQKNRQATDALISEFRVLSREFYEDKPGVLAITNNTANNRMRFDVIARIADDISDGINEVKMFCFDWLLLKSKQNHSLQFLFHDSRLLANMDPRQRAALFRVAHKQCEAADFQYIISVNQDMVEPLKSLMKPEEYDAILTKQRVLELTDESDATKLLGIHVDVDYEEEEAE